VFSFLRSEHGEHEVSKLGERAFSLILFVDDLETAANSAEDMHGFHETPYNLRGKTKAEIFNKLDLREHNTHLQ
jgi:hypothetical protein